MSTHTRIQKVFARFSANEDGDPPAAPLPHGVFSLAYLGWPRLFGVNVVPTIEAQTLYAVERQLAFPERCVGCGAPAEEHLSLFRARVLRRDLTLLERVPHCHRHAAIGPLLSFEVSTLGEERLWELVAPHAHVLAETLALNTGGDRLPPWRAFPALSPESSGWRQGSGEQWLDLAWRPYWSKLGPGARAAYVRRWPAPPEWESALLRTPAFGDSLTA